MPTYRRSKEIDSLNFDQTTKDKEYISSTEGSCLMRLLGPGKIRISQKSH